MFIKNDPTAIKLACQKFAGFSSGSGSLDLIELPSYLESFRNETNKICFSYMISNTINGL